MTITRKDLEPLKDLHSKGTAFADLMYEYMMELDEAELYGNITDFLSKLEDSVKEAQKLQDKHDDDNHEPEFYSRTNPFFEVL